MSTKVLNLFAFLFLTTMNDKWNARVALSSALLLACFLSYLGALRTARASPDWNFEITQVILQDYTGSEKTTFARGEIMMIRVKVTNIMTYTYAAEPFLMLAKIEKGTTMWGAGAFSSSLLSGESIEGTVGIMIPLNAPTGSYKAVVYVWTNWASLGGYPVAEAVEVPFTVT